MHFLKYISWFFYFKIISNFTYLFFKTWNIQIKTQFFLLWVYFKLPNIRMIEINFHITGLFLDDYMCLFMDK